MRDFFKVFLFFWGLVFIASTAIADTSFTAFQNQIKTALDNAYNGKGRVIKTPFGESQLLSCRTGIKDQSTLLTGLHIKLNKGLYLKNPVITATADNYTATPLKQIRTDLPPHEKWTEAYNTPIIFPIVLNGTPKKDITLTVKAKWDACDTSKQQDKECFLQQETYTLSLPVTESYATAYCGYISNGLKTAAIDIAETDTKIQNRLLPNGNLMLRLIFPKKNKRVELQSENPQLLSLITARQEDNIRTFIFKSQEPLNIGQKLPLLIRTTNGCYTTNIKIENTPLSFLPQRLSIWSAFWTGLFFFILSPLWCYVLAPYKLATRQKELISKLKKLQITYGISLLLLTVLWCLNIPLYKWTDYIALDWIVLMLAIYLFFKPFQPIWIIGLLTILLPKPFWDSVVYVSIATKIGLCVWFFLLPFLILNLWKLSAKSILSAFKKFQKENTIAYYIFVRLPYAILIVWLSLTLTATSLIPSELKLINHEIEKPAVIQVSSPISVSSLKDRYVTFPSLNDIPVYYITSHNEWANKKRIDYNIREKNFNLLITGDGQEIILPTDLSPHKFNQLIRQYY